MESYSESSDDEFDFDSALQTRVCLDPIVPIDSEDGDGFHLGHKILWIIKKELFGILVDNPPKKSINLWHRD